MTTRWRKLQFISFSQKVLLVCNSPPQAARQQLEHNAGTVVLSAGGSPMRFGDVRGNP
jgi:hypothetical protein